MPDETTDVKIEEKAPEPTLEEIYKESGITEAQPQTQQSVTPQVTQVTQPDIQIPDPYDAENFKNFMGNVARNQTVLQTSLQAAIGKLTEYERNTQVAKLEEDISKATEFVNQEAGIENKNLAHFELNERARTDPRFKALWENRVTNPEAFKKSLSVIAKEIGKKYEVKTDPQLLANKRALRASQQQSATTDDQDAKEPDWGSKTGSEFDQQWNKYIRPYSS